MISNVIRCGIESEDGPDVCRCRPVGSSAVMNTLYGVLGELFAKMNVTTNNRIYA